MDGNDRVAGGGDRRDFGIRESARNGDEGWDIQAGDSLIARLNKFTVIFRTISVTLRLIPRSFAVAGEGDHHHDALQEPRS